VVNLWNWFPLPPGFRDSLLLLTTIQHNHCQGFVASEFNNFHSFDK